MSALSIMFIAPPPNEWVLLLRRHDASDEDNDARDTWEFPTVGQFDHRAELEPWTDNTFVVRVDAPFKPPEVPAADFQWVCRDFLATCSPPVLHPQARAALRRFNGDTLDQVMAAISDWQAVMRPTHINTRSS
ncbi:MAG: hypothetical protein ACLPTF_10180 [Steroidobacteraceae bacterium]